MFQKIRLFLDQVEYAQLHYWINGFWIMGMKSGRREPGNVLEN
ncbi:hypothetical protein ECANGB1_526 [Enterospora canceri]|uniref:Uncharacterized protein n=1 Tax=Enterospora canceri TaxID=1081671 RepID=A0A1Y1S493_9MICR|nr:hypothetical protein ECANGB1_526 [Enterospora canceri]